MNDPFDHVMRVMYDSPLTHPARPVERVREGVLRGVRDVGPRRGEPVGKTRSLKSTRQRGLREGREDPSHFVHSRQTQRPRKVKGPTSALLLRLTYFQGN